MSNYPPGQENIDDIPEQDLHEQAGLVFAGKDEDGDNEWIGTDEKWAKYNLLTKEI